MPLGVVATSGSEETAGRSRLTRSKRFASGKRPGWLRARTEILTHLGEPLEPLTAFHATVRTTREKKGFKAGLSRRENFGLERR